MEKEELNDIILRIQKKDTKALEKIYNDMKGCVYGLAYVYTKSHSDSEDIVQNTFLRVWSKADTYKKDNPKAWIMTIARNLSIDNINQGKRFTELDENIRTDDCYSKITDTDMLNTLLSTLEETEREIVILYSYGFSHSEIAKITSKPYATVRWKYSNAIKKLIKISGGENND